MDFWKLYRNSQKIFLFERDSGKVSFDMKIIPADSYRFINSMLKVNIELLEIFAEGWQKISSKFILYPVVVAGMWSDKFLMFEDKNHVAIAKTPEKLKSYYEKIKNGSIDNLILDIYIEACGTLDMHNEKYEVKGDLFDEEVSLLNNIIHTCDHLSRLITDMLTFTSGMVWDSPKGWYLIGQEHTLVSIFGKWIIINSNIFFDKLIEGD